MAQSISNLLSPTFGTSALVNLSVKNAQPPKANPYQPISIQTLTQNQKRPPANDTIYPSLAEQNNQVTGSAGGNTVTNLPFVPPQPLEVPKQTTPVKGLVTPGVTPPSYGGLVGQLADASKPNQTQTGLVGQLSKTAEGNRNIGQDAKAISDKYAQEIARVGGLGAGAVAGNLSTGSNVVGSGNANLASVAASSRINSLSQAQQAELQGNQQQLTAQNQEAGAFGQALGGANTQQGQQLTGLGTAGSLAAPMQVPYQNQFLNPLTGESAGGGGLGGYAGYNAAEQAMALVRQYPDANAQYNPAETPEQNLQRIQQMVQSSPTYQKGTYGVPGQGNIAGATAVQTAQQGYQSTYQAYTQLQSQLTNAETLADNLQQTMASVINPTDSRWANSRIKDLQRQFNDTQRAAFDTVIKEVQAAFGNILVTGGGTIPTEATEAYNTILNPDASPKAIMASIQELRRAGTIKLQSQGDQVNTYLQQLQAGSNQGGGGASSGGFAEEW